MTTRVYIDTEFSAFQNPHLLSFGGISEAGNEVYLELADFTRDGTKARELSSDFVHDTVLTQFGRIPRAVSSLEEIGHGIADWLESLTGQVEIVFDYGTDLVLMVNALRKAGRWESVVKRLAPPKHVRDADMDCAEALYSFQVSESQGLLRHHALADARALRAACGALFRAEAGRA